jgi:hypothetical protein
MAHRECHTGTRLQIALKCHRTALVGELDDDINDPRSAGSGVWTLARVVRIQSRRKIRRQPGVVAARIASTLENVDDALGRHVALPVQSSRRASVRTDRPRVASMRRDGAQFQRCAAGGRRQILRRDGWLAVRPPSRFHLRALRYGGQVALRWTSFASPLT